MPENTKMERYVHDAFIVSYGRVISVSFTLASIYAVVRILTSTIFHLCPYKCIIFCTFKTLFVCWTLTSYISLLFVEFFKTKSLLQHYMNWAELFLV